MIIPALTESYILSGGRSTILPELLLDWGEANRERAEKACLGILPGRTLLVPTSVPWFTQKSPISQLSTEPAGEKVGTLHTFMILGR